MIGRKFIFVHIPKTGGNSITVALKKISKDRIKTTRNGNGVYVKSKVEKHAPLIYYEARLNTKGYFVFSGAADDRHARRYRGLV